LRDFAVGVFDRHPAKHADRQTKMNNANQATSYHLYEARYTYALSLIKKHTPYKHIPT
jgi:hypothetical protein